MKTFLAIYEGSFTVEAETEEEAQELAQERLFECNPEMNLQYVEEL